MEPRVASIPDTVHRIGRTSDPLRFSEIRPQDAALSRAGNRYDVPGGAVLYAASEVVACFGETLARYRPTPRMRELLKDEEGFVVCGGVPRDWRLKRTIVTLGVSRPLPFLDVDAPETHQYLSEALAPQLVALGYESNLDIADIRNSDRRLSRAIALEAYNAVDDEGLPLYSGIRYASRVSDDWECWAIFDGTDAYVTSQRSIEQNDPDLTAVADMWGLRIF